MKGKSIINVHETMEIRPVKKYNKIIAIASSTGGTEALTVILKDLPYNCPPILIVQHFSSGFTKFFSERLDAICKVNVRQANDNDYLEQGLVLFAPDDYHMVLKKNSKGLYVGCFIGEKVHGVMPAADILFESIADIAGKNSVGVILTGMGADGAAGLLKMRNKGAQTISQDKESCVVYGMPRVAVEIGAVDKEVNLHHICKEMLKLAEE